MRYASAGGHDRRKKRRKKMINMIANAIRK
jgi:hypothetical protein